MVPSRQVGLKLMATVIMVATILMTTRLKEVSTQELSTLNSLAQMENSLTNGLYPEFKRTGENDYELKDVYITDADGKIKEGPYQYDGKILGSKYSSVRQSQWSTY